jgi:membrane fusion protein (multidrug efflux system)
MEPIASEADSVIPAAPRAPRLAVFLGIAAVAGLGAWLALRVQAKLSERAAIQAAQTQANPAEAATTPVTLVPSRVKATAETWVPEVRFEGTLGPAREADLGFKVGGRLESIRVKSGDVVRRGAVLGVLSADEARAQAAAAEAQLRAAEAQLAIARDGLARAERMSERGVMTEASMTQTRAQADLAAAQADGARAQLELARVAVANHALTAPFDGVVTRAPTAPGVIVGPGSPLFRVQDVSALRLVGTVSVDDAALLEKDAQVELSVGGRSASGRVTAVLPSAEPGTRRVPLEAEVGNDPAAPLRAGGFVRAVARGAAPRQVLRLPASALRPGSQDTVMVVEGELLRARRLGFTLAANGDLLVLAGLADSDEVLLSPPADARDGDPAPRGSAPAGEARAEPAR